MAAVTETERTDRRAVKEVIAVRMAQAERVLTVLRAASAVMAAAQAVRGLLAVMGAITEAMEGREITSESRARARALWQTLLQGCREAQR